MGQDIKNRPQRDRTFIGFVPPETKKINKKFVPPEANGYPSGIKKGSYLFRQPPI
jgi:hypothetical protein